MMYNDDIKIIEVNSNMIPVCCREGHDNCPHAINTKFRKKTKTNIAL